MKTQNKIWSYKGFNVYPATLNGSGIRWHTVSPNLRADTKQSMKRLITDYINTPAL